jgi:hypothetical protein
MTRLTKALRETLWLADDRNCHYCREPLDLELSTFDHIVPRTFGGPTVRWNLVISCKPCNGELADAVRKCQCKKCKKALNRYHVAKSRRPMVVVDLTPEPPNPRPRSETELIRLLKERHERMRRKLNSFEDHDTAEAAALRGKMKAYVELLDLVEGIERERWTEALERIIETRLGTAGLDQVRRLYKDTKTR